MAEVPEKKMPSWTESAPYLIDAAIRNPIGFLLFAVVGFIGYLLITQPPRIITQIQDGYDRMELRREAADVRRDALMDKLADAIDHNTAAILSERFVPREKSNLGKKEGQK